MQFTQNAHVYTIDHHSIGRITYVILDPTTKKVTHLVVHHGIIFAEDKVVPVQMVQTSCSDGVILQEDIGDLHNMPNFEDTFYTRVDLTQDVEAPKLGMMFGGMYLVNPRANSSRDTLDMEKHPTVQIHRYVRDTKQNIPAGEVALKEGAWVISADGNHVGNVESVVIDPQTDYVTSVVISKNALLTKHRKLVPVSWIEAIYADEIDLKVKANGIEDLPETVLG